MLVVDASVIIKWVIDEEGTTAALALRRARLAAPDLIVPECANILWKKVRRREMSQDEARLAGRLLARANLDLFPMRRLLEPAVELAHLLDHPAYDCTYLALARDLGVDMVTADERLCRIVAAAGLRTVRARRLSAA